MFQINKDDLSIYATRGDAVYFNVAAELDEGEYTFRPGDVVRFKVYGKKKAEDVVLQRDYMVFEDTREVEITLTKEDTKIGEPISKPKDYWYEVELNPESDMPRTIIGYDEDGARLFKLFPEGGDIEEDEEITKEDVPIVDSELDFGSKRPIENQAVARAVARLEGALGKTDDELLLTNQNVSTLDGELDIERARITNLASLKSGSTTGDAELIDGRLDEHGTIHQSIGEANRVQFAAKQDIFADYKAVKLTINADVVYNVDTKATQSLTNGQYAEYDVKGVKAVKISGYSHSSPNPFPAAAFYGADGMIIAKIGADEASTAIEDKLVVVPVGATRLVINGKKWDGDISLKVCVPKDLNELDVKANNIMPEQLSDCVDEEDVIVTHMLSADNTELMEGVLYNGIGEIETGHISGSVYDTVIYPIKGIWRKVDLSEYPVGSHGGAFLDADKEWISSFSTALAGEVYRELKDVPKNAKYIAITKNAAKEYKNIYVHSTAYQLGGLRVPYDSELRGKKVVWLGTSVSFGQYAETAYPVEAARKLGFELVNCSVPGLAAHLKADGEPAQYGSLVMSKAEYASRGWDIPDAPIEYTPGGSYNNFYRTWENVFSAENADADLFVFDIVPNNTDFSMKDWNAFDFSNWRYTDGSSFESHRTTFLGALLFLMDKMYALNENARMVFVLGSAFEYWSGRTTFNTVRDKWNIPVIDLWGKVNTSPKSLTKLRSKDGTDPHPSTLAHEIMGRMLAADLPSVF